MLDAMEDPKTYLAKRATALAKASDAAGDAYIVAAKEFIAQGYDKDSAEKNAMRLAESEFAIKKSIVDLTLPEYLGDMGIKGKTFGAVSLYDAERGYKSGASTLKKQHKATTKAQTKSRKKRVKKSGK